MKCHFDLFRVEEEEAGEPIHTHTEDYVKYRVEVESPHVHHTPLNREEWLPRKKFFVSYFISTYLPDLFLASVLCKRLHGNRKLRELQVYHSYQQLEKPIISKKLKFAERRQWRPYHTSSSMAETC